MVNGKRQFTVEEFDAAYSASPHDEPRSITIFPRKTGRLNFEVGGTPKVNRTPSFGTPGRYIRAAVKELRAEGVKAGYVRPITLLPFPSEAVAKAAEGAKVVAVYENNQGQMIDDVRLAVLGRAPVTFIGGLSLDSSGFGIAPDLDLAVLRARIEEVFAR